MKILFMGTPEFALPTLQALYKNHELVGIVTQPDKPKNRGHKIEFSPIKKFALENNINVLQPTKLKDEEFIKQLQAYELDLIIVAAYGKIIPEIILNLPKFGCINVHASLLPKYRGAAPINWAIINGETVTGITIMKMDKGLDTGDIIRQEKLDINKNDDYGIVYDSLSKLGAKLLLDVLSEFDSITFTKQNDELSTYAPILTKEFCKIDWSKSTDDIVNFIRGLSPSPGAYTYCEGKLFKILKAQKSDMVINNNEYSFGEIIKTEKNKFLLVATSSPNPLQVLEIQEQGRKKMNAADYLKGHDFPDKSVFN